MKQKIHILLKRSISFGAALSLSAAGLMVGLSPATAQGIAPQTLRAQSLIMPAAVADTEFMAPRCEGSTLGNPETTGPDAYPNLLLVSGERLENYRDGHVVPLYDSYGYADGSYPPLCGVRYDAAADSPISEWMFCTDIGSKVCGDVLPGGQLGEVDVSVNPMEELAGNPRLDADQERLVSWLIHHESAYQGVGSYAWGGTTVASATRGTGERTALQTLIWCISDWPEASEADRLTTCEASMNQQEQQRILSLIPVAEEYLLELNPENSTVQVDDAAVLQLTTNIYGQPISLSTSSNAAIDLCEAMDGVVLAGTQLTLDAPASGDSAAIDLCVVASEATELSLNASVKPAQTVNIVWNQSQNNGEVVCQVFAGFRDASAGQISAAANITVKATVEPTEPTDPTVEPTEPTDPTDPTVEPTEPTDPTVEPTDPTVEPTDPTVEPTEPTDPTVEPTEPTDPTVEPTDPTVEPTDPTVEPTEPTDPTVEPTDPTVEPTDPTVEPTEPTDPTVEPTEPTDPTVEPTEPTDPTDPTVEPTEPTDPTVEPTEPTVEPTDSTDVPSQDSQPSQKPENNDMLADTGAAGTGIVLAGGLVLLAIGYLVSVSAKRRRQH